MPVASPPYYLGLCAIARDETPFLREWVAYHYRIGFEKIYIYDNGSSIPVRDSVADFYDLGVCDTYTLQGEAMQNVAYNLCLRDHGHEFVWLAFFDLDEFLCLKYDTDARVLLRDYEDYSALIVHWDLFSSSGHLTRPEGMVTLNYRQSLGYSLISKSIVRPDRVAMTISSHHFQMETGFAVNTRKEPDLRAFTPVATDKACLNHYMYRSQQDYAEKLQKADATYGTANPRNWGLFYHQAAKEYVERTDILPLALETQAMLESGRLAQKLPITLEALSGAQPFEVIMLMNKLLRATQYELAEAVFALCYKRFAPQADFIRLGITVCLKLQKTERAEELARTWLHEAPCSDAYLALLECHLAANKNEDAGRLGNYLLQVADHINDNSLKQGVKDLERQYSFVFSSAG